MDISKDLIAASSTPLILAILKNQDNYGYAIIKAIKEISNDEIIWTEGMLYPVLHRLEKDGYIESYWQKSENGRKRKYYRLKVDGLLELENQKKQWDIVHLALSQEITREIEE
ncbi:MAG TPA: PadR family transcriptional regulator [Clostridiales bacterium]|nr:PadR family transcriptional regulator [Clostridiales bacterium]